MSPLAEGKRGHFNFAETGHYNFALAVPCGVHSEISEEGDVRKAA
jgi:hypothetical protein